MPHVFVLVHRDAGPGDFCATREEAEEARRAVIRDEPEWAGLLWIERLEYEPGQAELRRPRERRAS